MSTAASPLRFLALGDSYTIGEAVPPTARWPALVAQHVRQAGMPVDEPQIVAVTGWTTDELAQGMDAAALRPPHDLVTLQIGVNNQYRGRSPEEYAAQFAALLERAIALAGGRVARVLVVSIPDWGVTPFARDRGRDAARIARELDDFNARARALAASRGVRFVDITPISRRHPELVAADGLHPSAEQYTLWADAIAPVARAALSRQP
jgi:lysophospholipase L1-like esterase